MVPGQQYIPPEKKRFRLVKFFAYASFIVLILFTFPFSVFITHKTKETLIKSYENSALLIGQNLNHQVFQNFSVPVVMQYGRISLREETQRELIDQVVKNTIHGFNIDLVNIYSISQGLISWSTDEKLIGEKARKSAGYLSAARGEYSSRLISRGEEGWTPEIERIGGKKKIRTYIPFKGVIRGEETIFGIFELIQDMTSQYEDIVKFQYYVFGLSSLIMGLIFFALLLIVHSAERILEKRAFEQRELEEQLHQTERLAALGEMVAGVSHEIKNPLGIIQSTAELLGSQPNADDVQKRLSGVINEESIRLNQIVTEFLDFARPQTPVLSDCALDEIIEKNLTFIRPELDKKGISVRHNLNGRKMRLKADQELLYQAFLNIFINAIQAMKNPGVISVDVEEKKGDYWIEIQDTGNGITAEQKKKIFNPFFTTKERGTGLGLSIVKKIIEGHNGMIDLESREGEGTRVTITLPGNR